jgi:hypothetical protein
VALNRLEERMIDGPMLFESPNNQYFVGNSVLYSALFLAVFAVMATQGDRLDFGSILVIVLSYELKFLMFLPTCAAAAVVRSDRSIVGARRHWSNRGTVITILGRRSSPPHSPPVAVRRRGWPLPIRATKLTTARTVNDPTFVMH